MVCLNGRFLCDSILSGGECIDGYLVCNGVNDCPNGEDEATGTVGDICEHIGTCNVDQKLCPGTSECIQQNKFCDGIADCANGEDEKYCQNCKENQFRCDLGKTCLYLQSLCDFKNDCVDGADEAFYGGSYCKATALQGSITLKNSTTPIVLFDDPSNDGTVGTHVRCLDLTCVGKGDAVATRYKKESLCNAAGDYWDFFIYHAPYMPCPICPNKFICYDGSQCIPRAKLCNGVDDCADGSDEYVGGKCLNPVMCASGEVQCLGHDPTTFIPDDTPPTADTGCYNPADLCLSTSTCDELTLGVIGLSIQICGGPARPLLQRYTCQDDKSTPLVLTCPDTTTITIVRGFWGRLTNTGIPYGTCGVEPQRFDTNCRADLSVSQAEFEEKCNGLSTCSVALPWDVFANPCPNNRKILEGTYYCSLDNEIVCSDTQQATCGTGGTCIKTSDSDTGYKCICSADETHPFMSIDLDTSVCAGPKCELSDCKTFNKDMSCDETNAGVAQCIGTQAMKKCICKAGYFLNPSNHCQERKCNIDVDCSTDGNLLHQCVYDIGTVEAAIEGANKYCYCAPGYELTPQSNFKCVPKDSSDNCDNRLCGFEGRFNEFNVAGIQVDLIRTFGTCQPGDTIGNYTCTCIPNYLNPFDENWNKIVTTCEEKCDDSDCGLVMEIEFVDSAFRNKGLAVTGFCSGTKSNYKCKCCDVGILEGTAAVGFAKTEHPDDGFGTPDLTTCALSCDTEQCGGPERSNTCIGTKNEFHCLCSPNHKTLDDDKCYCYDMCRAGITAISTIQDRCGEDATNCTDGEVIVSDNYCQCGGESIAKDGKCLPGCLNDLLNLCGAGAISCTGTESVPKCQCAVGYRILNNGKCIEKHCNEREINPCGANGKCLNGYWSWTCKCDNGFFFNELERKCLGCDVKACGAGYVRGEPIDYATSCAVAASGLKTCQCKEGFQVFSNFTTMQQQCTRMACKNSQCAFGGEGIPGSETSINERDAIKLSASDFGTCYGDYIDFTCKCNHNFELVESKLFKDNYPLVTPPKLCAPVDCSKSDRVLCDGNGYCVGYLQFHECRCFLGYANQWNAGFIYNKRRCVPTTCNVRGQCGLGATQCEYGSSDDGQGYWNKKIICTCDTRGYVANEDKSACVLELCTSENAVEACGEGATGCTGTLITPICECDTKNNFYPTSNFRSCTSPCTYNEEVIRKCGSGNTCTGTYKDFVCVCRAIGYRVNEDDPQRCDQIPCDVETDDMTALEVAIRVCGKGATHCTGTWVKPVCSCDAEDNYIPSNTLTTCTQNLCTNSELAIQGCQTAKGNTCSGQTDNFICICRAKGFELSSDGMTCEEISCISHGDMTIKELGVLACGEGALSCTGTIPTHVCQCDMTLYYFPNSLAQSCAKTDSNSNPQIRAACGNNLCRGPDDDYTCICTTVGWEYDPNDKQVCKQIDCATSTSVCGDEGVISCTGTVLAPACECNMDTHVPALNGRSCLLKAEAECLTSEEIIENCKMLAGGGNTCKGTKSNYICICQRYGYENNGAQECAEVQCTPENAVDVCGKGATGCSGTLRFPICQCDKMNNYVPITNLATCIKAPCTYNELAVRRCGPGNTCRGTFNEWECLCIAKGSQTHPTDKTLCKELYCDEETDHVSVCGVGAIKCIGLVRSPTCICDFQNGYVPNTNGLTCIPAECRHNNEALEQCGPGNGCRGTYKSWACICTARGYEADITDPTVCNKVYCNENTDAVLICGEGATKCEGPISRPVCICDGSNGYVSTNAGTTCVIGDCRLNPESKNCGPGNTCVGTIKSFQCMCYARGYEFVPGNLRACREIQCTQEIAVTVCGTGALDCSGTYIRPHCICDAAKNFISYEAGHRCIESDCRNNNEARTKCGPGNTCQGSFKSYQCICNAKGYTIDPNDPTVCVEVMCNDITDYVSVCGEGALGCEGSTRFPKCLCNNEKSFITTTNGQLCTLAGCQSNIEAQRRCGKGNGCIGTFKHYTCSCTSSSYEPDPNDVTRCILRQCNRDNAVQICGDGATDCSGSILTRICSCDTEGYTLAGDRHTCQPLPCRFKEGLNCLGSNTCSGTYFSAFCNCAAPNYLVDQDNPLTCITAPCNYERCGGSLALGFYATSCYGFAIDPQCACKEGYEGTGTAYCTPKTCISNPAAHCDGNGYCSGSYQAWICNCNAPNYIRDPANVKSCIQRPCNRDSCGRTGRDGVIYNHASSCDGHEIDRKCNCNDGYTGTNTPRCVPVSCEENADAHCDNKGNCRGNFGTWTCVCNGPDYIQDPTNPKSCIPAPCRREQCGFKDIPNSNTLLYFAYDCDGTSLEPKCKCKDAYSGSGTPYCKLEYCDENTDVEKICGKGATKCEGPLNRPRCFCDESRNFVANNDGARCVYSDCRSNPEYKQCGPGNTCRGSVESFQCVCSASGWENVPGDAKRCREIACDATNAVTFCGQGALSCTGTYLKPLCVCDTDNDFIAYYNNGRCYKANCRNSEMFKERCGEGNTCEGNIDSFHCICTAKGYVFDPVERTNCKRVMCSEVDDYTKVCGQGAIGCEGPVNDPRCFCDKDNNYVTATNGKSCTAASCYHNPEVVERCGKGNGCTGTYKQFACVCTSYGFQADENDLTRCNFRQCTNKEAVRVCGDGATECSGMVLSPTCTCDTEGYAAAGNLHTCQPLPCRFNKALNCGVDNTCAGTYFSAQCNCNAPKYMVDQSNTQACLPAPCVVEECGQDGSMGPDGIFAESCEGTYIAPKCSCKEGYSGSGTPYCNIKSCRDNPKADCGEGGKCDGTYFNWKCICNEPEFIVDIHDSMKCNKAPCNRESCGFSTKLGAPYYFASACEGSYSERKCKCMDGFNGEDSAYCKPKSCKENPKAHCDGNGECKGYYHEWTCVCDDPKYMLNPTDHTSCIEAPCKVENCGKGLVNGYHMNFAESCSGTFEKPNCVCKKGFKDDEDDNVIIEVCKPGDCSDHVKHVCGDGANGCEGSVVKPLCLCDESRGYVASKDGRSCVIATCENSEASKECGPGNSCVGTVKSFQCVCTADGWEADSEDVTRCREVLCAKINMEAACGTGTLGCRGTFNKPYCICDTKNNYVSTEDGKCQFSDCNENELALKKCGHGNTCHGTLTSYQCVCKAKGFKLDMEDPTKCKEVMCDDIKDYANVCGDGAIKCEGSTSSPMCICNAEESYVPTKDGHACVLADCHSNPDIRDECGKENGCIGTYKHYSCVCTAYGYTAHPTDVKKCVLQQCSSLDAVQICGDGATNCRGSILSPTCTCGMEGYQEAADLHSCQPLDCRFNKLLVCGPGNTCHGSFFSASCVCNGPAFMVNTDDPYSCKEAPCKKEHCGDIVKDDVKHYYAETCSGTYLNRKCHCKEGYVGDNTPYCTPEPCNDNKLATCGGNGRCKGSFNKWTCLCDSPHYMLNPINQLECIEAPCKLEQCGNGYVNRVHQNFATKCEGSYVDPTCYCREKGFVLRNGVCIIGDIDIYIGTNNVPICIIDPDCQNNPLGLCNDGGECNGDFFHFTCNCQGPEYEAVHGDKMDCQKALCDLQQCGFTSDDKNIKSVFYHATKCYGTYLKPRCDCKEGYNINIDTGTCIVAECSSIHNVCDGNGDCDGDYFHYTCSCFPNYVNPNENLKHCKPAPCLTHAEVCGGNGKCSGTYLVFDCYCDPGFQQLTNPNGQSTCVKASCSDDQCGGTPIYPHGSCGAGFYDEYNCTCKDEYAHPMLPDKTPITKKCDVKCDKTHCGKQGVVECHGTTSEYYCVCADDYIYPSDNSGEPIMTHCEAKCENAQCGEANGTALGRCSGTKGKYMCECYKGNSHPLNRALKPMLQSCEESCADSQCGLSYEYEVEERHEDKDGKKDEDDKQDNNYERYDVRYDKGGRKDEKENDQHDSPHHEKESERPEANKVLHGKCTGARVSYTCKCKPGFEFARDETKEAITTICKDINECEMDKDLCDENAKCINTPGSYRCMCKDKYVGMGTKQLGCYLNGGWGEWKHEECSQSCGGGITSKYRECLVRGVGNYTTGGNRTDGNDNIMKGLCMGEAKVHNIHCNGFDCDNLCVIKKCQCVMVRQFTKGNEPSSDLRFFDYIQRFDFVEMSNVVEKIAELAQMDICKERKFGSSDDIRKMIEHEKKNIKDTMMKLKRASIEMRNYINCNENPEVRENMFATYKVIANHMFMTSFIHNDLEVQYKYINKKLSTCSKHVMFGDLMDMLMGRSSG